MNSWKGRPRAGDQPDLRLPCPRSVRGTWPPPGLHSWVILTPVTAASRAGAGDTGQDALWVSSPAPSLPQTHDDARAISWVPFLHQGCAPPHEQSPRKLEAPFRGTLTRFTSGPPEFPYCREGNTALAMPRVLLKLFLATTFLMAQRREAKFYPLPASKGLLTVPRLTDKKAEACRAQAGGCLLLASELGSALRTHRPAHCRLASVSPSRVGWQHRPATGQDTVSHPAALGAWVKTDISSRVPEPRQTQRGGRRGVWATCFVRAASAIQYNNSNNHTNTNNDDVMKC